MSRRAPFFGEALSDDPKELGLTQRIMIPVADLLHNEEKLEIWNLIFPPARFIKVLREGTRNMIPYAFSSSFW